MKHPEYVGISGVVRGEDRRLRELYEATSLLGKRVLQLGVKATHKSQYLGIDTRYGSSWFPVGDEIDEAVHETSYGITGVAQVVMDADQLSSERYRRLFMPLALGRASNRWLTGVQFDMLTWYDEPNALRDIVEHGVRLLDRPDETLTVTLQCQGEIMNRHTPQQIVRRLGELADIVDYVLFDGSCGRGVRMDSYALLPYLEAVRSTDALNDMGIAVAGGLNAEVAREVLPGLLQHFPDLSWDAEGQLHPMSPSGDRPLDLTLCKTYLEACADVVENRE